MTKNLNIEIQPEIVLMAFNKGITDIGQITLEDRKLLRKAIKEGYLLMIPDYSYPVRKSRYVMNIKNYDIMTGELKYNWTLTNNRKE